MLRETRTVESLTRLEKAWLKRRLCGWCEVNLLGKNCYAMTGKYILSPIKGVLEKEEVMDLGKPCNMDEQRAEALKHYKPRATAIREMGGERG